MTPIGPETSPFFAGLERAIVSNKCPPLDAARMVAVPMVTQWRSLPGITGMRAIRSPLFVTLAPIPALLPPLPALT
eukprot:11219172-Lingulodinium_polyedra.AAC.1